MKRLTFILLFFLPFLCDAQLFNGGILSGANVSQVDGDTYDGYHKFGFYGGAFVSLQVSRQSSFQMEMEYFQKGSRKNGDSVTNQGTTYLLRLHYLEIPILYQYSFHKRFSAEIGPAMDILLGSEELVNGFDPPTTVPLRPVTLCGIIGINGYITQHLRLNFRFNYSILSIRDGVANGYRKILFETGQYNNVLSFGLIWDFKPKDL
ncbi:MAG: porin family protein [Bacteroidales bacterium]|nr:porin family protein [Bacteroidales bacterium]